ncbi:MAG: hypothetical protein K2Z81_16865, partial [Cyanobacteria bacterium]|nr:hypothetical protein [Cyanobacteriota bacterium]
MNTDNTHNGSDKAASSVSESSTSHALSKDADLSTVEALDILRSSFAGVDRNDDGFASEKELFSAMENTAFGSKTYKALYSAAKNIGKVEALNNDEWGPENNGISKEDLNKVSLMSNRRVWNDIAFTLSDANEKPDSMPNLAHSNAKVIGAANAIRTATKKDNWVDFGTDENAINSVLKNLSEEEKGKVKDFYEKRFGISLRSELRSEMSGLDLEKSLNILERKDNQADDAGFFRELALEQNSFFGRTEHARGKAVRDKLASMTATEIEAANKDANSRYKMNLQSLIREVDVDQHTKSAIPVYLKGVDQRSNDDILALTEIALEARDLDMLKEAMRGAPDELRRAFMTDVGMKRLYQAFANVWDNTFDDSQLFSNYRYKQQRPFVIGNNLKSAIDIV